MTSLFGKPGEQVPAVDPADIKAAWNLYRDVEKDHSGQLVGVSSRSFEKACKPGANIGAVGYRAALLRLLVSHAHEQYAAWIRDGQPDEALFGAIAQTRMEWIGEEPRQGLPIDEDEFMRRLRGEFA